MRLISFSISNFRSFREEQKIVFSRDGKNTTAIFGPNGAGKTNLFKALEFFCRFIRTSTKFEGQILPYESFLLNTEALEEPTAFEAEFVARKRQFRYRFVLLKNKVIKESLKAKAQGAEDKYETIFSRPTIPKGDYGDFYRNILKLTRENALVLTKAWENNDKDALEVFEWLDAFMTVNTKNRPISQSRTAEKILADEEFKERVLELMRRSDLSIQDINVAEINLPEEMVEQLPLSGETKNEMGVPKYMITTLHLMRDGEGDVVGITPLTMGSHESVGTQRIFELARPILEVIDRGGVLYIDEFENDLHPRECKFLVSLFEKENPKNAQLIINTHSTILLDQLGRDNIRLVAKNGREESVILELTKLVRADDEAIERKYNKGILGGVPRIRE